MTEHQFSIFADYFQFFIADEASNEDTDLEGYDAAQLTRVIAQNTRFTIIAARNMDVPVTVAVSDSEPSCDLGDWDHIVDASINAPSGKLVIAGCTDYLPDAARIPVPAGSLRVRALFGNLDDLSEDQLDGKDCYRIVVWPAPPATLRVRKQHATPSDTSVQAPT